MQRYLELEELVTPAIDDLGYDLVRLMIHQEGGRKILQIMIERKDMQAIAIEDCEKVSREVSAILDVENPIEGAYSLEISSPGLDRPLVKLADFKRFCSFAAKIETEMPVNGVKRFKGKIVNVSDDEKVKVLLDDNKGEAEIPFLLIAKAKLIITDELIKHAQQEKKGF